MIYSICYLEHQIFGQIDVELKDDQIVDKKQNRKQSKVNVSNLCLQSERHRQTRTREKSVMSKLNALFMVRIVDNITPTMSSSVFSSVVLNECDRVAAGNDDKLT